MHRQNKDHNINLSIRAEMDPYKYQPYMKYL